MLSPRSRFDPLKYFIKSSDISGIFGCPLSSLKAVTKVRTPLLWDSQLAGLPTRILRADPLNSLAHRGPHRYLFSLTTVCSYIRHASTYSSNVDKSPAQMGTPSLFFAKVLPGHSDRLCRPEYITSSGPWSIRLRYHAGSTNFWGSPHLCWLMAGADFLQVVDLLKLPQTHSTPAMMAAQSTQGEKSDSYGTLASFDLCDCRQLLSELQIGWVRTFQINIFHMFSMCFPSFSICSLGSDAGSYPAPRPRWAPSRTKAVAVDLWWPPALARPRRTMMVKNSMP